MKNLFNLNLIFQFEQMFEHCFHEDNAGWLF